MCQIKSKIYSFGQLKKYLKYFNLSYEFEKTLDIKNVLKEKVFVVSITKH